MIRNFNPPKPRIPAKIHGAAVGHDRIDPDAPPPNKNI
jgi:hypothetical protein